MLFRLVGVRVQEPCPDRLDGVAHEAEDGKEDEVFCLIGPKRFDVPWKVLEGQGFIDAQRLQAVAAELGERLSLT